MKHVYELDVYKLSDELSDMVWHDFDNRNKKVLYKIIVDKLGPKLNAFINSTKA